MLLAATQWWTADQGGAHVLWFLPLFLLLVFRPALRNQYAVKDFFEAEKVVLARLQEWWKKNRPQNKGHRPSIFPPADSKLIVRRQ